MPPLRGWHFYNLNLGTRVFLVETPEDVLLLDAPIVLVNSTLHTIEYQRLIKIRAAAGVENRHPHSNVLLFFLVYGMIGSSWGHCAAKIFSYALASGDLINAGRLPKYTSRLLFALL